MQPIRYIFFSFFFPISVGVKTHETSAIPSDLVENTRTIPGSDIVASPLSTSRVTACMCMYTFDVTNGRESGSEKPVAKETEIRIHVGGGEERRDENKGERKKKEREK